MASKGTPERTAASNDSNDGAGDEQPELALDTEIADAATPLPDSGETSEGGKLKMIVQVLKRCLGVKDLAAMRLSLPASLLEPIPNLEYWQYLDRPDLFAAINDSADPFQRMLAVIRFTFTKDLKFVHGKVCKPYNSVLGEHFRAHWDVLPVDYPSDPTLPPVHKSHSANPAPSVKGTQSEAGSMLSFFSSSTKPAPALATRPGKSLSTATSPATKAVTPGLPTQVRSTTGTQQVESNLAAQVSNLSLGHASASGSVSADTDSFMDGAGSTDATSAAAIDIDADGERIRIAFLTEQVSHHPPISAYHAECPARHIEMTGIDQIAAKVSGTSVRVAPGAANKGIFVKLTGGNGEGEQYQITHPVASVNGVLRGSMYVTVSESTIITCSSTKEGENLRAIIEYKDESWLGNPKFSVEGIIHSYSANSTTYEEWTKVKHVPRTSVVAQFDGSWRNRIRWKRSTQPDSEYATLLDLSTLLVVPKRVRPIAHQLPNESRKLWENVTDKLIAKEYSEATKHKLTIEQKQRDMAAERKKKGEEFVPTYFDKNIDHGVPTLTTEGRKAIEDELKVVEAGP